MKGASCLWCVALYLQIVSTDVTGEVKMWDLDGPNLGRSLRSFRCDPRAAHVLLLPNVYQVVTSHPDGGSIIYDVLVACEMSRYTIITLRSCVCVPFDVAGMCVYLMKPLQFDGDASSLGTTDESTFGSSSQRPNTNTFAASYADLEGGNSFNRVLGNSGKKKKKWKKRRKGTGGGGA